MANITWNGSTASAGGKTITPLTELHAPNDPADFDTTGSTDATHLHGTGKHKPQITCGFLGSQFAPAGVPVALSFTIGAQPARATRTRACPSPWCWPSPRKSRSAAARTAASKAAPRWCRPTAA